MRLLVMFDLPSVTNEDKKEYRHFVKLLKKEGFYMIQESIYSKLSTTPYVSESTVKTIQKALPPNGNVFVLNITEKQFNDIKILMGKKKDNVLDSIERVVEV